MTTTTSTRRNTSTSNVCFENEKCYNNGKCVKSSTNTSGNECRCAPGYKGKFCKEKCTLFCENGGYCYSGESKQGTAVTDRCVCLDGFYGPSCNTKQGSASTSSSTSSKTLFPSRSSSSQSKLSNAVIGIIIAASVCFVIIFLYCCYRKCRKPKSTGSKENETKVKELSDDEATNANEETVNDLEMDVSFDASKKQESENGSNNTTRSIDREII